MDGAFRQTPAQLQATLSNVLKALRRRSGLRSVDVARQVNMSLRSYQRFEAGEQGLDVPAICRFAQALGVDDWAILLAVDLQDPAFALSCADNKAASAFVAALKRFNTRAGKDLALIDTRSVILVLGKAFEELSARARAYEHDLEAWMVDGALADESPPEGP